MTFWFTPRSLDGLLAGISHSSISLDGSGRYAGGLLAASAPLSGLVPRFPTLIAAMGLGSISILSFTAGLILDTLSRVRIEQRRLAYLALRADCPETA